MDKRKFSKGYVVCNVPRMRKIELNSKEIHILPYMIFLEKLWAGEIF